MQKTLKILQNTFGHPSFRENQKEIIQAIISKNDTFALLPTSGGKSLCYQLPAIYLEGTAIVLCPYNTVMKDQVEKLQSKKIPAEFLNCDQTVEKQSEVISNLLKGKLKLLFLSPERLFSREGQFLKLLSQITVSFFAINEAHCISQYGHDFRSEYLKLSELKKQFRNIPVIALTSTADKTTQKDILDKLKLDKPIVFTSGLNRANINYHITPRTSLITQITDFINKRPSESGIIYVLSRKSAEEIAVSLQNSGFSAKAFYAGLNTKVSDEIREQFINDKIKIIVSTIASKMSIEKSDIRYVIHTHLSKNIESYYQEIGKAGRDGIKSDALLLYDRADWRKLKIFNYVEGNPKQTRILNQKLDKIAELCENSTCRRHFILNYFGETSPTSCYSCDICLNEQSKESFIDQSFDEDLLNALKELRNTFAQKEDIPAKIVFPDTSLIELATYLPENIEELAQIKGFGGIKAKKYGTQFLNLINNYCKIKNQGSRIYLKKNYNNSIKDQNSKLVSCKESLELFLEGKSIPEIATIRGLKRPVVENHLAQMVAAGEVSVFQLVPTKKVTQIAKATESSQNLRVSFLRKTLGTDFLPGEIKAVLGYLKRTRKGKPSLAV